MPSPRPSATHHARITEDLRRKIRDWDWAPGHRLERETELAQAYGVSRMTMNKALSQLSTEGYLIRRKRSGTFVAQPRAQSGVMEIGDIAQEVAAQGLRHDWRLDISQLRRLTQPEAGLLDLQLADPPCLFLQGVHLAQQRPFCLETRAINPAMVPSVRRQDFAATLPGQWLLKTTPWGAASHRIRAVHASRAEGRRLSLPPGAACLEVLRKTQIDGDWVTHVRMLYPGDAHQLMAELTPYP